MLQALYAYAQRAGLLEDPDFEERAIDFIVTIRDDGAFVGLTPTRDEKGRGIKRARVPRIPSGRTVAVRPAFLVDNAQYTLGLSKSGSKKADRGALCAKAFAEVVNASATRTNDVGVRAVAAFMGRLDEQRDLVRKARGDDEWTGDEVLAFSLASDDGLPVHERGAVRDEWAKQRAGSGTSDASAPSARCLVSGELAAATTLHPPIKAVPSAQSSGAYLVSFNAAAFQSHDAEQGDNAPVSRAAAEGYAAALNHLLARTPTRRFRSGVVLGAEDAVVVFWTRDRSPLADDLLDLLDPARDDSADAAVHLAEAPLRGLAPSADDVSPFYAMTLSGNASRVVVRGWIETTAAEIKANVRAYFDDLEIVGLREDRPLSIYDLERAIQITPKADDKHGLPAAMAARLFGAALRGHPFPRELLPIVLRRVRLPPPDKGADFALGVRCALLKATLRRLQPDPVEVSVALDEQNTRVPYLLGRLFAVLERLQASAQGKDLNATLRDRYFGAASTTPVVVFGRLLQLSAHHAAKVAKDGHGWLERLKGEVIDKLPAEGFPSTLGLADQAIFAIGYYHQRQAFFVKRSSVDGAVEIVDSDTKSIAQGD
jgi:CRISPR-associated protein Csd1